VCSSDLVITVAKPGSLMNRTLNLVVEARGEADLAVTFNVTMTRTEVSSGAVISVNGSIRVDQPSMSAFGQHVEWKLPPPAPTWHADLDGNQLKFADVSRHEFTVRLACDPSEPSCAADGDVITTIVQLVAVDSAPNRLHSEVRVVTQVQPLLSCGHTLASIEPDSQSVSLSTAFRAQVLVHDVDNLPVVFTRAEVHLAFGGRNLPMQWSRGSNEYVADVPAELTGQPGVYVLVVNASNAWKETGSAGSATSCELLRRTITVNEGLSTKWVVAGAGTAAVVITGGFVIFVRKRHAHLQAIMVMLVSEVFPRFDHASQPVSPTHY
jgi:hypothetical protein